MRYVPRSCKVPHPCNKPLLQTRRARHSKKKTGGSYDAGYSRFSFHSSGKLQETNRFDTSQPFLISTVAENFHLQQRRTNDDTDFSNEQVENGSIFVKTAVALVC